MTRFTASNKSDATLKSSRKDVWVALTDAELLPKLTPYLNRIDVVDDRWTWHVTKVPILGKSIGSTFTEVMTFDEPKQIGFDARPRAHRGDDGGQRRVPPRGGRLRHARLHRARRHGRAAVPQGHAATGRGCDRDRDGRHGAPVRQEPAASPGREVRILVLGATGYVGSRVVPALLDAGHEVVAASSSEPRPARFAWGDQVDWVRCDVTDAEQVRLALTDVEGICYLVHSLNIRSFEDRDRRGAQVVQRGGRRERRTPRRLPLRSGAGRARRGPVPAHLLAARGRAGARGGRVGDVLGALLAGRRRARRRVDVLRGDPPALHAAARAAGAELARAQGATDRRERRDARDGRGLRHRQAGRCRRRRRPQRAAVREAARRSPRARPVCCGCGCPPCRCRSALVSLGTAALCAAPVLDRRGPRREPAPRHGLPSGETWVPGRRRALVGVREAMSRALGPVGSTPEAALPSDPDWTRMRAPVLDELHAPATVRAGASLALRRVRALMSLV